MRHYKAVPISNLDEPFSLICRIPAATINQSGELTMATWVRCTTSHGDEIRVNLDHVATVRQYQKDRGGTGCEITFAGGVPSAIVVKEDQEHLTGRLGPSR